ncbi:hypothetical protein [Paenimyroides viscosum]|uniref:Uncharacterized protein n=1 Tax=Paenimyroides viscosum TaxID=2488729 RepID=A0A3P1B2N4_9FLAO|nr:hypothetical protein [Paenimyroides viscosum]RRA95427.1 hypothetical protein EG242_06105 [Paenimyroides viscosum]
MEEILASLQHWEAVRSNPDVLTQLFINKLGFKLDMNLFPQTVPLHAYAGVKNGELGFYVISEVNDVNTSSPQTLSSNCIWCPCVHALGGGQEISKEEAEIRVKSWNETYQDWIHQVINMPFGMYQTFHIPTTDLQPQKYAALFALKDNVITSGIKAADLVLTNNQEAYFDTIRSEPPYTDTSKYYILSLI